MISKGKIDITREKCKGCYLCTGVCPKHMIVVDDKLNKLGYHPACFMPGAEDNEGCTGCTLCAIVCPEVAIEVYRAK